MIYNVYHNFFEITAHKDFKYVKIIKSELMNIYPCSNCDITDWKPFGNLAIKLSNEIIVRCDVWVKRINAKNLKRVYGLLNYSIICISYVYRFFIYNSLEYIVMKYVKFQIIDLLIFLKLNNKVAQITKISRKFV